MTSVFVWLGGTVVALVGCVVLLVVVVLAPIATVLGGGFASGSATTSVTPIATAALQLQDHVFGVRANQYDVSDPFIQPVYRYWVQSCGSNGTVCLYASSGDLQCVEFVTAVFFLHGQPLAVVPDAAYKFWAAYQHLSGWKEYPSAQQYPTPGDMLVWSGGEFGHIAIVVRVVLPSVSQEGTVTVAQANAPGNRWEQAYASDPGNWYTMPLNRDGSIQTWSGYTVLGVIRAV